ncbi:MAG: hypothetical protein ACRED1_02995, partial [Limisphaerales bacterium]
MRSILLLSMALAAALPLAVTAQSSTNAPATEIESFDLQTDAVIVKGTGQIGSIATEAGTILVRCRESDNVASGQKQYAIAIGIQANQSRLVLWVDYDELDALIQGMNFLSKVNFEVTTMPSFDAIITTRSGFRAGARSERQKGSIQLFAQFQNAIQVPLTPAEFAQL